MPRANLETGLGNPPTFLSRKSWSIHGGDASALIAPIPFPCVPCLLPFPPHRQLQNKGEQGDATYAEAVPWLEAAHFGGFLATREVMDPPSGVASHSQPPFP